MTPAAPRSHNRWSDPQFVSVIDGQPVHFLHLRSPEPHALPLLLTHGWPGSIVEFLAVLGPLANPRAYGADPADAFHLVVPSIPGFGFSGPTRKPGWDIDRIAMAWVELMHRLGYERYGTQGGDWGAGISTAVAALRPDQVVGVHRSKTRGATSRTAPGTGSSSPPDRRRWPTR